MPNATRRSRIVKPVRNGWRGDDKLEWRPLPLMDEYIEELHVNEKVRGYIRKVELGLGHFSTFCIAEGVKHPLELERKHILRYQGWLLDHKEWKPAYRQQLMKYVRGWINWMIKSNYMPMAQDPWVNITIGSTPKKPNPMSDDELNMIFERHRRDMYAITPFYYHRRELILTFLYGWGLRLHELEGLNVQQMDDRQEYVTVRQKGGTLKELPYSDMMKGVYIRYVKTRAQYAKPGEDALIIDVTGKRVGGDGLRRIIVDLGKSVGLDIHPHMFRDTCGTHLLDSDMEAERVQKILGHSTLKQTLAYSRVNRHKVAEAHDKAMTPRLGKLIFGEGS